MKNRFLKVVSGLLIVSVLASSVEIPAVVRAADINDMDIVVDDEDESNVVGSAVDGEDDNYGLVYVDVDIEKPKTVNGLYTASKEITDKYDSRVYNNVTPIKDQNPYGTCWAFSLINAIESGVLVKDLYDTDLYQTREEASKNYNLSERFTAYNFYHREGLNDKHLNTLGDYVELPDYNGFYHTDIEVKNSCYGYGGNNYWAIWSVLNWEGPVYEVKAPYKDMIPKSPLPVNSNMFFDSDIHVQDAIFFESTDIEGIKNQIMEGGTVMATYHAYSGLSALGSSTNVYNYYNDTSTANHAIGLIGWDDNYKKENFYDDNSGKSEKMVPKNDGAWLMKNSWGTGHFDDGYCWISYEDASLDGFMGLSVESNNNYVDIYYHDGGSFNGSVNGLSKKTKKFANVFKNETNSVQTISAVGFGTYSADVDYTVKVAVNEDKYSLFYDDVLASKSGSYDRAGYHTVELDEAVNIQPGQTYSVIVEFADYENICADYEKMYLNIKFFVNSNEGTSYFLDDNENLVDISKQGITARIKAYGYTTVNIEDCTISGIESSYKYQGSPIVPNIKIVSKGIALVNGVDYDLEFDDNVNVGTCSVVIKGKRRLRGDIIKKFEITKADAVVTAMDRKIQRGTALPDFDFTEDFYNDDTFVEPPLIYCNDENGSISSNVAVGEYIINIEAPENIENDNIYSNYNITYVPGTLTVTDEPVLYNVDYDTSRYDFIEETIDSLTDLESGTKIDEPKLTIPVGKEFFGWYTDPKFRNKWDFENKTVRNDMTLYPKIETWKYNVEYNGNGGISNIPVVKGISCDQIHEIKDIDKIDREYYFFKEWNTKPDGTGTDFQPGDNLDGAYFVTKNNETVVLYAIWEPIIVNVMFDANGGDVEFENKKVRSGQEYGQLPVAENMGYTFEGWYTDMGEGSIVSSNTIVSEKRDHYLYARWGNVEVSTKQKMNIQGFLGLEGKTVTKYKVFSMDNAGKATVTKKGILTGKKAGRIKVIAFNKNSEIASGYVNVVEPFYSDEPIIGSLNQTLDASIILKNIPKGASVSWTMPSKSKVISLSDKGVIKPLKNGKVKVTAVVTNNGFSVKVPVKVVVSVPSLSKTNANIKLGKTQTIKIKNLPKNRKVTWYVEGDNILIANSNDNSVKIQGVSSGSCKLIARVGAEKYICNVVVQ